MRRARTRILFLVVACASCRRPLATHEHAQLLVKGKWKKTPARTMADVKGFRPQTVKLSRYGGWLERRAAATGFFRTEKINGRWWLVDPEGYLFISVGLCSVRNTDVLDEKTFATKFATPAKWAETTGALLISKGFNSLGCWSDWRPFRDGPRPMPYFPRWNFMSTYKSQRDPKFGARGYPHECMPVFDPAFESFCDKHAKQLAATKDDAYLVGHFSDNELPFRPDLLEYYLKLPASDPGHQAAAQWWAKRRGVSKRRMTRADKDAFLQLVAHRYYSTVAAAIRRHDPNHLYVGSRIHGRTIVEPVFRGARAVDVMSVNYYHRWSAEPGRLRNWVAWSGRPFLVSEWYAQSVEPKAKNLSGAGFRVRTDRERGLFYQNLTLGLLESRGCVGAHWFKYSGDEAGFHKGVVNARYEPHEALLREMGAVNRQTYPLAAHFLARR